ncbi:MAG TPA: cation:proton antiporter [Chthoniobacterales bacterium]
MISPHLFVELHALDFLFAALALVLARPAAMFIALWRSELGWREQVTASWFGPKGFASVVFGLLLFEREVPHADRLFRLCALVIVGSIVAHSSSDTLLARWFVDKDGRPTVEPEEEPAA